jgi:hypothetical protein
VTPSSLRRAIGAATPTPAAMSPTAVAHATNLRRDLARCGIWSTGEIGVTGALDEERLFRGIDAASSDDE